MGTDSLCTSCLNRFTQRFIQSNNVRTKSYCIIDKNNALYNVTECSHRSEPSPSIDEIRAEVLKNYDLKEYDKTRSKLPTK